MKAYRQTARFFPQNKQHHRTKQKCNQFEKTKITLRRLANNHQLKEISLNCNQSLNIIEKPSYIASHSNQQKQQEKIQICVGNGEINILRSCFEHYNEVYSYIFVANSKLDKESFDDSLQKEETNNMEYEQKALHIYKQFGQKRGKTNCNIFTVQERPSQSIQSELQQPTIKQQLKRQKITNKYTPILNNQQIGETYIKPKPKIHNQSENAQQQKTIQCESKKIMESHFGFSEIIKNGYVQCQNVNNLYKQSFQIAGDEEIQREKQIDSCLQQLQVSSILKHPNQIEKIQEFVNNKPNQNIEKNNIQCIKSKQLGQGSKQIDSIDMLQAENEQQMDQFIQITENIIEPNRSEFYVKYNIKVVDKKTPTRVVRVSPLKFRKKSPISNEKNNKFFEKYCPLSVKI